VISKISLGTATLTIATMPLFVPFDRPLEVVGIMVPSYFRVISPVPCQDPILFLVLDDTSLA